MFRTKFFARAATRTALGLALAAGAVMGASAPAVAKDKAPAAAGPKFSPSKGFLPAYGIAKTAIEAAEKRADVVAARGQVTAAQAALKAAQGKTAQAAARAKLDAAMAASSSLLTPEKTAVAGAAAAAVNTDDKFLAGQLLLNVGTIASDLAVQRRGVQMQIDSGRVPAADLAKYHMVAGNIAMDLKDFAGARASFTAANAAGSPASEALVSLADGYIKDNQAAAGLKVLQDAVVKAGAAAPETWMRFGIATAYRAKLPAEATMFSNELVGAYPTKENWSLAIAVVRDLNQYQGHDQIDLLRLMDRTKSYSEERDFVEYIQAATKRGMPGEALKVIDTGVTSGLLKANDQFVVDAKRESAGRVGADRASLPKQEADARGPRATALSVVAAADTLLSYDQAAKAEELYNIALTKAGVDTTRVNLRLGIAQIDQGKYAAAQANLAKVNDARAPIAKLWSAYAAGKLAGK